MHKHHINYSCPWLLAEGTCWEKGRWEWGVRERYEKVCSTLNVCVPSKCMCWNPVPSVLIFGGGTFGRWLSHEGRALMNEISALIKETPELPQHFCSVWTQWEDSSVSTRKQALTRHQSCWCLDFGLLSFQNCDKCLLVKLPSLWDIIYIYIYIYIYIHIFFFLTPQTD